MFPYASYPRRLNLGCGLKHRAGYLNVDLHRAHNPDLLADVTDLSMLPDGYYEEIVAHDLLEHIQRTRTVETLAEWNRLLQPGGRLELKVPGLLELLALFQRPENQGVERQLTLLRCLFGSQAYTGDYHFTAFTPTLLTHYLERTGFAQDQLAVEDDWMLLVVAHKSTELDAQDDLILIADPAAFLEQAYRSVLGRDPDPEGRDHYLRLLRTGEIARQGVLEALRASDEYVRGA
jgi:predicted SAM-dependent methyltransferase